MRQELTDRDATVGATEVDVALGDGSHAQLIVRPGEERGEGAGKYDVTVSHGAAYRHTHLRGERKKGRRNEGDVEE